MRPPRLCLTARSTPATVSASPVQIVGKRLAHASALIEHNCPGARVHSLALGRSGGRLRLDVDADGVIASRDPTPWQTTARSFDVVRLDDFVADHEIERVALLKIDAEGMEVEILDGAAQTLHRTSEVVLETHGRERHEGAVARLEKAGFGIDRETFGAKTGLVSASRQANGGR